METLQSVVEVVRAMGKREVEQNKGEAGLWDTTLNRI